MDAIARIRELMAQRSWTTYRLSQESGITITTLINLFHRGKQPSLQTVETICEAMNISMAEFFAQDSAPGGVTEEQTKLFTLWDSLTEEQREAMLELLRSMNVNRME